MEFHALPQVEDPRLVVGVVPLLGEVRRLREVGIDGHQPVEGELLHAEAGSILGQPRIERIRVDVEADTQQATAAGLSAGLCWLGRGLRGRRSGCRCGWSRRCGLCGSGGRGCRCGSRRSGGGARARWRWPTRVNQKDRAGAKTEPQQIAATRQAPKVAWVHGPILARSRRRWCMLALPC